MQSGKTGNYTGLICKAADYNLFGEGIIQRLLKAIAQRIHRKTVRLAKGLEAAGFKVEPDAFFDTITVDVGLLQRGVLQSAVREGINLRRVGDTRIGITLDERTRPATPCVRSIS